MTKINRREGVLEKICAGLIIWVFVAFGALPLLIGGGGSSSYMRDLKDSFMLQLFIGALGGCILALVWAVLVLSG